MVELVQGIGISENQRSKLVTPSSVVGEVFLNCIRFMRLITNRVSFEILDDKTRKKKLLLKILTIKRLRCLFDDTKFFRRFFCLFILTTVNEITDSKFQFKPRPSRVDLYSLLLFNFSPKYLLFLCKSV